MSRVEIHNQDKMREAWFLALADVSDMDRQAYGSHISHVTNQKKGIGNEN